MFLLDGILQFFNYEIQIIPAIISEQPGIKAKSYRCDFCIGVFEREMLSMS